MDQTIEMAVTLARKGVDNETIDRVVSAMRGHVAPVPSIAVPRAPNERHGELPVERVKDRKTHEHIHHPVLDGIRVGLIAHGGTIEATMRELVEWCRPEWLATQVDPKRPNVRGLAAVVATARMKNGGVLRGLRFTFLRVDPRAPHGSPRGSGNTVYRVEVV